MRCDVPSEIREVIRALQHKGFRAYLVGGCVRDLLSGREPKDWDVATDAVPDEVRQIFPESVYENEFGTVRVKTKRKEVGKERKESGTDSGVVEVTTFRKEGRYTDRRHPDKVVFAKTIEEDLARRDFTVNAMAMQVTEDERQGMKNDATQPSATCRLSLVDPFGGQEDLKRSVIRTVGNPDERFKEDALRLMRAVRLAVELDFAIEPETRRAIASNAHLLEHIAKERVRDELGKIIASDRAATGIILLEEYGLLVFLLPELSEGVGVTQNKHHVYTVFEHNVRALDYAARQGYSPTVRMASLLHDIGKPRTKQGEGPDATFHAHEVVGAKMAAKALERLRFPREFVTRVVHLIRHHMFYYNVGEVSEAGVRRFLRRVGPEYVSDLIQVREADRIGSGVPKAVPYKLRHFLFMIEKVKHDPLSPKMLAVCGEDVMRIAEVPPGPRVGYILAVLLEEVIEDPTKNTRHNLESRIAELAKQSDEELQSLAKKAREIKKEMEEKIEESMKAKYHVR